MIRCDLFQVYLTHGKKKPHLMLVCLHSNHIIFTHVKKDKSKETTVYEYRHSIEVNSEFEIWFQVWGFDFMCVCVLGVEYAYVGDVQVTVG